MLMNDQQRNRAFELKRIIQNKLRIKHSIETELNPFLEIISFLNQYEIEYQLKNINVFDAEEILLLKEFLQEEKYAFLGIDFFDRIDNLANKPETILDLYPSTNDFRYVPTINKIATDLENISLDFNRIVDDLNLYNEKAFIYFFNYLPIIESNIKDLLTLDLSEIFTFYHGDALIYPKDLDWLIVYGLEDEWFYTKK